MTTYQVTYLDNITGEEVVYGTYEDFDKAVKDARSFEKSNYVFLEPIVIKPVYKTTVVTPKKLTWLDKVNALLQAPLFIAVVYIALKNESELTK